MASSLIYCNVSGEKRREGKGGRQGERLGKGRVGGGVI